MAEKKFVFIITDSHDNPDKVAGALQLATNMKAMGGVEKVAQNTL